MSVTLERGDALLIIHIQNDFIRDGSLAVPRGEEVVPVMNAYVEACTAQGLPMFATRDWHPANHCSFRAQGGPWPPHCVQGSSGAEFVPELRLPPSTPIVSQATSPDREAYSSFQETELDRTLKQCGVRRLLVGGLATDYCVFNTVRDALALGYRVLLLQDAVRAVDVEPGDGERAIHEMLRLGAQSMTLSELKH